MLVRQLREKDIGREIVKISSLVEKHTKAYVCLTKQYGCFIIKFNDERSGTQLWAEIR